MIDFTEEMETGRQWNDVFKVLQENNCQPRNLYQAKMKQNIDLSDRQIRVRMHHQKIHTEGTIKRVLQVDGKLPQIEAQRFRKESRALEKVNGE